MKNFIVKISVICEKTARLRNGTFGLEHSMLESISSRKDISVFTHAKRCSHADNVDGLLHVCILEGLLSVIYEKISRGHIV